MKHHIVGPRPIIAIALLPLLIVLAACTITRYHTDLLAETGNRFDIGIRLPPDKVQDPPLIRAAKSGDVGQVRSLLEKGENANVSNIYGETALMWSALRGHDSIVGVLLRNRAEMDAKDQSNYQITALAAAAARGHSSIVDMLLQRGANMNGPALIFAAGNGHTSAVRVLLNAGIDTKIRPFQILVRGVIPTPAGNTALLSAIVGRHSEIVRLLIDNGADANARYVDWAPRTREELEFDKTPLMIAAELGQTDIVKMLLDGNASIHARHFTEWEALMYAVWTKHAETIRVLLRGGADVNVKYRGDTALMLAARNGDATTVQVLITAGADVNAKVPETSYLRAEGDTPLRIARKEGHAEVVEMLKNAGAVE